MKYVKIAFKVIFVTIILGLIAWVFQSLIGLWKKRRGK